MKVLIRGTAPDAVPFRGTCRHCQSLLEATRLEMKSIYAGDQREPGEVGTAACPVCAASVSFYPVREQ